MKNDTYFVKSQKENYYLIVSPGDQIIPVHPIIKELYDLDIRGELPTEMDGEGIQKSDSLYLKQYLFFKSKGWFSRYDKRLTEHLGKDNVINKLSNLRQVLFEVTDGCNLNCKYCGYGELYGNYDNRTNKNLDFGTAKALIDYLWEYWCSDFNLSFNNSIVIGFYGGEPLLNTKLIRQIITYIGSRNTSGIRFQFNMTTNGILLNKYMDFLKDHDFSLLISLDGDKTGHSYRTMKNGENSFEKVIRNVHLLKNKYPDYFMERVNFNSVLHDRNNSEIIFQFIKREFGKIPRITELNSNGIAEGKKKEFWEMFKDKFRDLQTAKNCEELKENMFYDDPEIAVLDTFINQYAGNTFRTYNDLLGEKKKLEFLPTGTCYPFQKKIFLTVNGKILPCEKVGQHMPLGYIKEGIVQLDIDEIVSKYEKNYHDLISQCNHCSRWKICSQCFYFLRHQNGKLFCPHFEDGRKFNEYSSRKLSYLEDHPQIYERLFEEVLLE